MKSVRAFFAKFKQPKFRRIFILVSLLIVVVISALAYEKKTDRVSIEDSLVESPISSIAPTTPGDLKKVYIFEGESIKKGDPIADVGDQTLSADSDGLVIKVNDTIGSIVSTLNPVAQIIDPTQMRIDGTLDENKGLDQIKIGQIVSFSVDALPGRTFWGYVDEVSPTAKATQLSFSISSERPTQQFEVFAKFNSLAYPEIKNGMSAKMTVYTKTPQ